MNKILKISFILLFILITGIVLNIHTSKAANIDLVSKTINPSGTYDNIQARYLQKELNCVIGSQIDTTGIVGTKTITAIKNFQRAYGLTVDGIVGPATRAKLNEAYKANKLIVCGNTVNVRDKAGFNSNVLGQVKKGDILTVYGSTTVSGKLWYKIWYQSGFAYITADSKYVRVDFVEIDIVSQTIRVYKNKVLLVDSQITTGRADGKNNTAPGYFTIVEKGHDTSPNAHMEYWIGFDGYRGNGIHDASWRGTTPNFNYFGGKVYKNLNYPAGNENSGSHGCVNVPPTKMDIIYPIVDACEKANPGQTIIFVH